MSTAQTSAFHLLLELTRTAQADEAYIEPEGEQRYVLRSEGGGAETITIDWSAKLFADLDAIRRPGCDPAIVQRIGNQLRKTLAPAGWARHEDDIVQAAQRGDPVYITIRSNAAELYALPWELLTLKSSGRHLGELPEVLLRYAWPESTTVKEAQSPRPEGGRILFAWSAAAGAVPLKEQLAAIRTGAEQGQLMFERERDVVDHVSLPRLARALERAAKATEPVSVLHLLCHGTQVGETYGLAWDADEEGGEKTLVDASQLRRLIAPYAGQLRLVVLSACDSGNTGKFGNHLGSIAQNLHQAGIACVVASRFPLSVKGSIVFTEVLYERLCGDPASVESALSAARQALFATGGGLDWASITLHARPDDGDDSRPFIFRPYRGLLAFQPSHRKFFFGRDAEIEETISDLSALIAAGKPRFLVVAGASGTGKSSMVLAGVVPRLLHAEKNRSEEIDKEDLGRVLDRLSTLFTKRGAIGSAKQALAVLQKELGSFNQASMGGWEVRVMRPGSAPLEALKAALALREKPDKPFLIVVDQLEEIFTHVHNPAERQAFAAELWRLCSIESNIHCITSIRVDFVGECGQIVLDPQTGLRLDKIAYDEAHRVFVAQMGAAELRTAIEEPAKAVGLSLEAGLPVRIINEAGAEPSALPLIEYVLDMLWQRREGRMLLARVYDELGGVFGALEQMADSVVAELDEPSQKLAFWLFSRLTHFGEGSAANTRRRMPLARLLPNEPERRAQVEHVLARFVDARLLLRQDEGGQIVVEIAHEALLRRWKRLVEHLNQDRAHAAEVGKLEQWAADHKAHGVLLRGAQLGYARQIRVQAPFRLDDDILAMIDASEKAEADEQAAMEKRRMRERRLYALGLAAAAVIAIGMVFLSIRASRAQKAAEGAKQLAEKEKELASAEEKKAKESNEKARRQLRISSAWLLHGRGQESSAASLLTRKPDATAGDGSDLRLIELAEALLDRPIPKVTMFGHNDKLWQARFSPDGNTFVTASSDRTARIWSVNGKAPPRILQHEAPVYAASFDAEGKYVLTASEDGTARIWNITAKEPTMHWEIDSQHAITTAVFAPDGQSVATGSADGVIELWSLTQPGGPILESSHSGHTNAITALDFQKDGKALASAGADGTVCIWPLHTPTPACADESFAVISSIQLWPDGQRFLTASHDGAARIWDTRTKRPIATLLGHQAAVNAAVINPRFPHLVATSSDDNTVRIWMLHEEPKGWLPGKPIELTELSVLTGHEADVTAVSFAPDGESIVTGSWDQTTRIWDLKRLPKPIFQRHNHQPLTYVQSAPTQDRALVLEPNGDVSLHFVDLHSGTAHGEVHLDLGDVEISHAAFSPSGNRLLVGGTDGELVVFEIDAPNHRAQSKKIAFRRKREPITGMAWDAEENRFVTLFSSGAPLVWNANKPQEAPQVVEASAEKCTAEKGTPGLVSTASGGFTSVAFSHAKNDNRLALGREDGCIWVLTIGSSQKPLVLARHSNAVDHIAFSDDGQMITTASQDSTARIWQLDGTSIVLKHPAPVVEASFDSSGKRILSKSRDNALRVWNVEQPENPITVLSSFSATVPLAMFDRQEKAVLTICSLGLLQRWQYEPDAILRSLTEETLDCTPVLMRMRMLSEDRDTAKQRCEACVAENGMVSQTCD